MENEWRPAECQIIRNNPGIRIDLALKRYNSKKTSLAKSAEIAGLTTIEFKELLVDRGIKREIEGDEIEEIDRKIKEVFGRSWSPTAIF